MSTDFCSWVKPRPGHVVVYPGRGDLLAYEGVLAGVQLESKEDRCWGIVQASAVEGLQPGDCVMYTKYEGMTGPSLSPEKAPLVVRGDAITCVVDMGELNRLRGEAKRLEEAAAKRLADERANAAVNRLVTQVAGAAEAALLSPAPEALLSEQPLPSTVPPAMTVREVAEHREALRRIGLMARPALPDRDDVVSAALVRSTDSPE